jgi:hypothetical protein
MLIPDAKLEEFIVLYQKHYGITLARDQALEKATKLLNFMKIIVGVET